MFYPRKAYQFERAEVFCRLPVEDLKKEIVNRVPQMKEVFERYLKEMGMIQTLSGRERCVVPISKDLGEFYLLHSINEDGEGVHERIENILSLGPLSQELRLYGGVYSRGLGGYDPQSGADDSVFVQLLKKNNSLEGYYYSSKVRLVINKKVLDTVTYQYNGDQWGARVKKAYQNRLSL